MKGGRKILRRLGAGLLAAVFAVLTLGTGIVYLWPAATNFVDKRLFASMGEETAEPGTVMYYTPEYATWEEAYLHSGDVAEAVQAEGTVLLENNGALPLPEDARRISVFGTGAGNIAYGGTGSGAGNTSALVDLYTALEGQGFSVNPVLRDFYRQKASEGYHRGAGTDMNGAYYGLPGTRNYGYSINEVEREAYTQEVRDSYEEYGDAALVVISRSGGEGQDLPTSMEEFYEADGRHYLELTVEEEGLLEEVKAGGFSRVVVLLNVLNPLEAGFLQQEGIDAALWIGGPGQHGLKAVAKVLTGELEPCGRLPDTWAADLLSAPAMQNYGDNRYVDNGEETTAAYVAYEEGIYVGYRYYETRALEEGKAWYQEQVVYPFGYGLSYTSFQWTEPQLEETGEGFAVSVSVENTGSRPGKDVVELFVTKPYTNYDRQVLLEKSAVDLVGFAKTETLQPGERQRISIPVQQMQLASYDTYGHGTYLAEAGTYTFSLSRDAHTPVFALPWELAEDQLFSTSPETGYPIQNRFETADYSSRPEDMPLLSRQDWEGTWPGVYGDGGVAGKATKTMTPEKKAAILSTDSLGCDTFTEPPRTDSGEGLKFTDLFDASGQPLDYDDPMWMRVVECLSKEELYRLISGGGGRSPALETIDKRLSKTSDSPMGLHVGTLFPCYPIQAATWNTEMGAQVGACVAEEALWNNIRGWYAPAMDTHRTPFGGRAYEYYSEDGVLAGTYAAAVVARAKQGGLFFHIKHFALNDQDTNRGDRGNFRNQDPYNGLCTYAGEQSIREIYLKPFELAITQGGANGVMTAYNRIGDTWAGGHYGLLTEVLRNEWGMHGNVLTDYAGTFGYVYMDMNQGLRAGNSQWLFEGDEFPIADKDSDLAIHTMQRAAKDILYAEASSRVNNQRCADGTSVTVRIHMPLWKVLLGLAWLLCAAFLLFLALRSARRGKPAYTHSLSQA